MNKKPDFENHYILLSTGEIVDLLDPLIFDIDIETTVTKKCYSGVEMLQCANSATKLFNEVLALDKETGAFLRFGSTNWANLFLIHDKYNYFLAFTAVENDRRHLAAQSTNGIFWTFNVNDA